MLDGKVAPGRIRRIRYALLAGALALFALLYAPQPVLPQLAGDFSRSAGTVALLVSAGTLGLAFGAVPLGTLSEAVGRRRTMVSSLLIAEVLGLSLPWIHSFWWMAAIRFLQGIAIAGLAAVAVAYLADETGGRYLGTTMGLYIAGTTIGGMSGRIVGGIVGDFAGWASGVLTVALLAGVCTAVFAVLLPVERLHQPQTLRWKPLLSGLRAAVSDPVLFVPYLIAALGMGSFVAVYNVLGFRLTAPPLLVPPALAALAFLAYGAGTITSALAGRAAERHGRPVVLLTGLVIMAGGLLTMLSASVPVIVTGLVMLTGGFFAAHSVASGWVGARASASARGQASALYQFCYYAGSSVGGVLGGSAFAAWGWSGMTGLLCCWIAVAALSVLCGEATNRARRPTSKLAHVASGSNGGRSSGAN